MNYTEALKKVRAEKPKENFMVLEFGYGNKFLLPHKDGVSMLNALVNAEKLVEDYGKPKRILGIPQDAYAARAMSYQEYECYKVAALLNISPEEAAELMKPSATTEPA